MKKIKKYLLPITLVILLFGLIGIGIIKKNLNDNKILDVQEQKPILIENEEKEEPIEEQIQTVFVDIKGAIVNPGVYEIEENKKVIDVIQVAGGFTEQADTSMINLAKKVNNEMVVIIYTKEEVKKATEKNQIIKVVDKQCICPEIKNDACLTNENSSSNNQTEQSEKKININTATLEELQTLTGIGESKAKAIIQYREEKGSFKTIEELKEVSGIGDALYEKVKDDITI